MKVYLSAFIGFKDSKYEHIVLKEFNNVKELDNYTKKFNNSNEIKRKYQGDIQEFLMDINTRDNENGEKSLRFTKDGKPIVYLSSFTINDQNGWRFIDTLYKDSDKIVVLTIKEVLKKIEYYIERIKEYNEKYKYNSLPHGTKEYFKALGIFRIGYSEYDRNLLYRYLKGDENALGVFLERIKEYLKSKDKGELYGILRFNKLELRTHHLNLLEKYNVYYEEELAEAQARENNAKNDAKNGYAKNGDKPKGRK